MSMNQSNCQNTLDFREFVGLKSFPVDHVTSRRSAKPDFTSDLNESSDALRHFQRVFAIFAKLTLILAIKIRHNKNKDVAMILDLEKLFKIKIKMV